MAMSWRPCYIAGLLIFGGLNTLTTKIQWTMYSVGANGKMRKFAKPWFACLNMFLAMAIVAVVHGLRLLAAKLRARRTGLEEELVGELSPHSRPKAAVQERSQLRLFLLVGVPGVLDLVATGASFVGFIFIPSSTYQMLRGSMIIFSAVESVIFLRRRLYCFNWLGVFICIVGVTMVGLSQSLQSQAQHKGAEALTVEKPSLVIFGVLMVLLGQFFQATQVICEEQLLKGLSVNPYLIVGYEGIWGSVLLIAFVLPLLNWLPGSDEGSQENYYDTIVMLRNSVSLQLLVLLYLFSCSTYNISGMQVTGSLSAVHRTMLEASRTAVIWLVDLFVHYCVSARAEFGETWTVYSWMQLASFIILVSGQAIYGGLIRVPGLYYENTAPQQIPKSPEATKSMACDLPPAHDEEPGELQAVVQGGSVAQGSGQV